MQSDPLGREQGTDGRGSAAPAVRALDDETAFKLLSNGRRRTAIRCLASAPEPVGVADLAEAVAARERGDGCATDGGDPAGFAERRRVAVALGQVHLPKLAEAGAVSYDGNTNVVTPTPTVDALADRLARASAGRVDGGPEDRSPARGGSFPVRIAAAVTAAGVTTLALSERVAAAAAASLPALAAAALVAFAAFGALTLAVAPAGLTGDDPCD